MCKAVMDTRIPAQVERIQSRLAFKLNTTLPGAAAAAVIASQVQQAYLKNKLAESAASAADIIRQNAMLNAIDDTTKLAGQKSNDPAAMVLAVGRAQAVAQQNASWLNYGKVAEQALPVFRNVVEALTYALFPLVVLLLLLSGGRETLLALKGYALILIWIQLWPPLFAILNYVASIYAAYDVAAAADLGTGTKSLSLQTASAIYARAISGEAIVGYLSISVPLIAWAVTRRMEGAGSALIGGLSSLQSSLGASTGNAVAGNMSMGNVSMDQLQLAPNRTSAFMAGVQSDLTGNTLNSNALTGRAAVNMLRNQGFASRVVSTRVSQQDVTEANQQAEAAQSEAISASQQRSASLTEAFSRGVSKLKSNRASTGTSSSSFEQWGDNLTQLDQISRSVAERTGVSQSQVAHIAFSASGSAGFGALGTGARVQGSAGKNYQSGVVSDEQKVLNAMTSEQVAAFKQFGDRVSRDNSMIQAIASDGREAQEMASRLGTETTRAQRTEATYSQRRATAERFSAAYERGETISIDLAQDPHNLDMFMRYSEQYGGSSAAAHTLMEAELARQGLPPTRVFTDGSKVPVSPQDVGEKHHRATTNDLEEKSLTTIHQQNNAAVLAGQSDQPDLVAGTSGSRGLIRKQIEQERTRVSALRSGAGSGTTPASGAGKTTDGTLKVDKSLLLQTGKQVAADAESSLNSAKDAVKRLFSPGK